MDLGSPQFIHFCVCVRVYVILIIKFIIMVKLLLGEFTFLDPVIDGEHKCIINKVEEVVEFDNEDLACKCGESMLDLYDSYLVLPTYKGKVVYE